MSGAVFFYLGLTFLLLHEMDAVRCREWRIFPGLSQLSDRNGFRLFMLLHIPLLFLLLRALPVAGDASGLVMGIDIFLGIHLLLHLLFLRHPNNEFRDALSWSLIVGAALFGALDLAFFGSAGRPPSGLH
jgi:hypothetical protein